MSKHEAWPSWPMLRVHDPTSVSGRRTWRSGARRDCARL